MKATSLSFMESVASFDPGFANRVERLRSMSRCKRTWTRASARWRPRISSRDGLASSTVHSVYDALWDGGDAAFRESSSCFRFQRNDRCPRLVIAARDAVVLSAKPGFSLKRTLSFLSEVKTVKWALGIGHGL